MGKKNMFIPKQALLDKCVPKSVLGNETNMKCHTASAVPAADR